MLVFRPRFAKVQIRSAGPSGRAIKTSENQVPVSDDTTLPPAPPPPDDVPPHEQGWSDSLDRLVDHLT